MRWKHILMMLAGCSLPLLQSEYKFKKMANPMEGMKM